MIKYCKFYIEDKCKYNDSCKFGDKCKINHIENNNKQKAKQNNYKLKKINTESFELNYNPHDANIVLATPNRDIIIAPNIFENSAELYDKLVNEMQTVEMKMWHGYTHLIADDHANWKSKSPTFNMIVTKLAEYFNIDVKATRFN